MIKKSITIVSLFCFLVAIGCNTGNSSSQNETNTKHQTKVDNYLANNTYRFSYKKGDSLQIIQLVKPDTTQRYNYGTFITFDDSENYEIYYTAPCGNDCFFSTRGKYYLPEPDIILLAIDSTKYWGECREKPTEYGDGKTEKYKIEISNREEEVVYCY